MIAFRYSKTDEAIYLSHLDLLRHVDRTLRRAGIKVNLSEGFHRHPKIFLNNPLPLGVGSVAEYGAADCEYGGNFAEAFNAASPAGIKCLSYVKTDKNPNFANTIEYCGYTCGGITPFCVEKFLGEKSVTITDMRGRETDIIPKIVKLEFTQSGLYFELKCGTENLRPDLFCRFLEARFGGKAVNLLKIRAFGQNVF